MGVSPSSNLHRILMQWQSRRNSRDYWLHAKAQGGVFKKPGWAFKSQRCMRP